MLRVRDKRDRSKLYIIVKLRSPAFERDLHYFLLKGLLPKLEHSVCVNTSTSVKRKERIKCSRKQNFHSRHPHISQVTT